MEVALTVGIILFSLTVIYTVSQWELPQPENGSPSGVEWVLLQPQKCADIPWRSEWARVNQKQVYEFPVSREKEILTTYYRTRDVDVLDATLTYQPGDPACTQCGCPEAFVYGIKTTTTDAARLAASGFTILDTGDPFVFTGPLFRQSTDQPLSTVSLADCDTIFATHTPFDQFFGNKKDSCFIQAAISARDVSICEKIYATTAKTTCVTEVATALKSPHACQTLPIGSAQDTCYTRIAGVMQNKSLCAQVVDSAARSFCELSTNP